LQPGAKTGALWNSLTFAWAAPIFGAMRGFANSDKERRTLKARKIDFLVGGVEGLDLLDLGAGSGLLSSYFVSRGARVTAADRDASLFAADCPFVTVTDTLPFADYAFDLVVFNHVIEHVGTIDQQDRMLSEIRRVIRPGGRLYLAAPTKWALIEPHFRIPLLGAMPRPLADTIVRLAGKGERYDCFPLTGPAMRQLAGKHFGAVREVSVDALRWAAQHEHPGLRFLPAVPALFPTRMFIATA